MNSAKSITFLRVEAHMAAEQLIEQILSKHPEVPREQIEEKLAKERKKTNGLISDETLLRMIAAEFGILLNANGRSPPELSMTSLVPGLNNVSVVGRVLAIYKPKTFTGHKNGKFASFFIADKSRILRVVFWNSKADLLESGEVKVGEITRVSHGYTKEGREGIELHVGEKSKIETCPQDVKESDFPTVNSFLTQIRNIGQKHRNKRVNIAGTLEGIFKTSTFERQDSTPGKVMHFTLKDETGETSVVAWNEKADELEAMLKEGMALRLVNAKVKTTESGNLEIHVDSGTYAETFQSCQEYRKVANLEEGLTHVNVNGTVVAKPTLKEIKTVKQELVNLATFQIEDETGRVWVSAWRQHALEVINLKTGDKIAVKNVYTRKGFSDQLEISTRDSTSIVLSGQ